MRKLKKSELYIICGGQNTDTYPDITLPDITVIAPEPDPGGFPDGPSPIDPDGGNGEPTPEPNPLCTTPSRSIDYNFISGNEGGQRLLAYWPGNTNSGVTVGTGVDLHGRTQQSMSALGWPQPLIDQLLPYTTQQGNDANTYLNTNPLNVSQANADIMDQSAFNSIISQVAASFDSAASFANFDQLPSGIQTAIADIAYQYGPGLSSATPNFWAQITTGRWQDALNNLRNFGDTTASRRLREAAIFENAINNHRVPTPNDPC